MSNVPQPRSEIVRLLQEQIGFIRTSASLVDNGDIAEGKRIATSVRILVHDTQSSKSVFNQLDLKDKPIYSTAGEISSIEELRQQALIRVILVGRASRNDAPLDDLPPTKGRWISFDEWWNQPVFLDKDKQVFTRKNLVLIVANKDGGAHVDPKLPEIYVGLSRGNSAGWTVEINGVGPKKLEPNPTLLSLRQIGHEVIVTVEKYMTKIKSGT